MLRRILIAGVLAAGLAFSGWLAFATRPHANVRTVSELEASLRPELALATDQGLVVVEDADEDSPAIARSMELEEGECLAVVAVSGSDEPVGVMVTGPGLELNESTPIVHVAACASSAGAVAIEVSRAALPFDAGEHMHFAIARGHLRSPRTYARLTLSSAQRIVLDAAAVRARLDALAPEASRLEVAREANGQHAVLVPATRATFAALRALSGRADVAPRVDAEQQRADPFASEGDVATVPLVFTPAGQERVLAVVDAGALGQACVEVLLARLDDPPTATPLRRLSIPELTVVEVTGEDPAILVDAICPADGLFVYTTALDDGADYLVTARGVAAEADLPVAASHFGDAIGGRHPSDGLVILPVALVASSRAECDGGSAEGCLALASLANEGIEGAGTVREALEPLCGASGGVVCDVLAGVLAEGSDADALERRACSTGVASACLRRGARFLAGASDLTRAYRTFRFGCAHASSDCCTAASTMTEWDLAPAGEPDDPPEPG